jgi:hypothetical protein
MKYLIREYSWWSTHQTAETVTGVLVLFTITVMAVGIMIVCFTQPKQTGMNALFYIDTT